MVRIPYEFESYARKTPEGYLEKFLCNLKISEEFPSLSNHCKSLLTRYIEVNHSNAQWYSKAAKREIFYLLAFSVLSLFLLFILPIFVVNIPTFLSGTAQGSSHGTISSSQVIMAQIMAVLAGILALYRTLGQWLNNRKLAGYYWEARSHLVEEIYVLETEWADKPLEEKVDNSRLTDEFEVALRESIAMGRKIIREMTAKYYANYSAPEIDLAAELQKSATGSHTLLDLFKSPRLIEEEKQQEAMKETVQALEKKQADKQALEAELGAMEAMHKELAQTKNTLVQALESAQEIEKEDLKMELTTVSNELRELEAGRREKRLRHATLLRELDEIVDDENNG